jgi:hypothetical protein
MKSIVINSDVHSKVKVICAVKNIKIQRFVNDALQKAIKNESRKLDKAS